MYTMNHLHSCIFVAVLLANFVSCAPSDLDHTKLVLVHILFRHGARTTYNFYPTDPHRNLTFYPIGLGGLTNEGKYGEYKLGKWLRKEYDEFLSDTYTNDVVKVTSTDTARTKMSAQLVLAGMWPPTKEQMWHPELAWQPIPVYYKDGKDEDILSPTFCDYRTNTITDMPNKAEVQESYVKPYKRLFDYISYNSGLNIKSLIDLLDIYFVLSMEDEMGLPLPDWTKKIYPEPLIGAAAMVYNYWNYDEEVRKINSGYLLKKLVDDSLAKINGSLAPDGIKMFMYSGHESTLGCLLDIWKVTKPHIPVYGSAVIIELRKNRYNEYFLQLKYHKDTKLKPKILTVPGCEALCPVEKFQYLQRKNIPTISYQEACSLPSANDVNIQKN